MIEAARIASAAGTPINRLLTIRTQALRDLDVAGVFTSRPNPAEAVKAFVELLRHWCVNHGTTWAALWSRENAPNTGEHLHVGFHMRAKHDPALVAQLHAWTGEATNLDPDRKFTRKPGFIAVSSGRSWLLEGCARGSVTGPSIAAYLGKDEPDERLLWGTLRANKRKPHRGGKHAAGGGLIEGLGHRRYRSWISPNISPRRAP